MEVDEASRKRPHTDIQSTVSKKQRQNDKENEPEVVSFK